MSVNQIIVNFISEIYSINYIQDSHLTLLSLSNGHRQLHKIIIDSYYEYYNGLSESYQNAISINNVVNLILILAVVCISIVILILMIKMEEMIRSNEYAILLLFTKIRGTPTLITPIHNFIFELVGSSNEIIDAKEADLNYIETNDLLKSNMSSRENTRRDLMEEPQSRRSNFGTE